MTATERHSPDAYRVLSRLNHRDATSSQLQRMLGMDFQAFGPLIRRLRLDGLIRTTRCQGLTWTLTDAGRKALTTLERDPPPLEAPPADPPTVWAPSPEEIRAACLAIQAEWSTGTEMSRRGIAWRSLDGGDALPTENPMRLSVPPRVFRHNGLSMPRRSAM